MVEAEDCLTGWCRRRHCCDAGWGLRHKTANTSFNVRGGRPTMWHWWVFEMVSINERKLEENKRATWEHYDDPAHSIEVSWCPSHCNIPGIDKADELAKEATQLAWSAPIGTSRAFALRRAKATTQSAWIRDWQKSPRKGRFAIANRIPPSLNSTKHFTELQNHWREVFGRLVQCRCIHKGIPETVLPREKRQL